MRSATGTAIAKAAAARGTRLTLRGTRDPWPPATLQLWLFDQDHRLLASYDRFRPPDWATLEELLDALAPWLGELPFGEKDALSNSEEIVTAAPNGELTWRAL